MSWHIICQYGVNDRYIPAMAEADSTLLVPFNHPNHPDNIRTLVPKELAKYGLTPTPVVMDFLCLALAVYTADLRIPRRASYDNWTRDLVLHVGVYDLDRWRPLASTIAKLLSFLTGDHWQIDFRHSEAPRFPHEPPPARVIPLETNRVSLFSGGLDSFTGVIDALETRGPLALVGHHAQGHGATSRAQDEVYAILSAFYDSVQIPFLRFWATPPKGVTRASENTTRGRSILFLALGITVASCLQEGRLQIPENGFISLNIPLTSPRLGSFSTRTTHPYLIKLVQEILETLTIPVAIEMPYRFLTKGEIILRSRNQAVLREGIANTMSCAHPGVGHYVLGGNSHQHCGYCFPCLIRRAAIRIWGDDLTDYAYQDLNQPLSAKRGSDLRAVKIALEHYHQQPPTPLTILTAGPLPGANAERNEYLGVFRRGLEEIRDFLF